MAAKRPAQRREAESTDKQSGDRCLRRPRKGRQHADGSDDGGSSLADGEVGADDDTTVRRMARGKPGALLAPTLVMMVTRQGHGYEQSEIEEVGDELRKTVHDGGFWWKNTTSRQARIVRSHSPQLINDQLLARRTAQAGDILAQRFRASEASLTEEGGWTVARHLEVLPLSKVNTLENSLRATAAER